MQIREFNELEAISSDDLLLIQKGDQTGEYRKIKAENLLANASSSNPNTGSSNYSMSSASPNSPSDGFKWDELNAIGNLVESWTWQNNKWVASPQAWEVSTYSNKNESFFLKLDNRRDYLVHGYYGLIHNLSNKAYPSGTPPIQFRIRQANTDFFNYFGSGMLKEVGSSRLTHNESQERSDYFMNTLILRSIFRNYLVINTNF